MLFYVLSPFLFFISNPSHSSNMLFRVLVLLWKAFDNSLYKGFIVVNNIHGEMILIKFQQLISSFEGAIAFSCLSVIAQENLAVIAQCFIYHVFYSIPNSNPKQIQSFLKHQSSFKNSSRNPYCSAEFLKILCHILFMLLQIIVSTIPISFLVKDPIFQVPIRILLSWTKFVTHTLS